MLDVHPNHAPLRAWRDFFIHFATIVVGLCIAVGIQMTVRPTPSHVPKLAQRGRRAIWWVTAIVLLVDSSVAHSQPTSLQQSFDIQIPWRPMPLVIGGKELLLYELHLTNFASTDLALKRIEIVDSAGVVRGAIKDSELKGIIARLDHAVGATDKLLIPPGVRVLAYLSVPLGTLGATPSGLMHRIEYQASGKSDRAFSEGGAFALSDEPPVSVGPPLRGGPRVAIYDTSWERGHRRVPYAVQGSVHIPGRALTITHFMNT